MENDNHDVPMTDEQAKFGPPKKPFQIERRADFVERYANTCGLSQTVSDFRITFSIFSESPNDDPRPMITEHTAMLLSPQQAKMLHRMLAGNLQHYEKQ